MPAEPAAGRIAETISPCPPGAPVVAPGEVIAREVPDHPRSGVAHGFPTADAAGPSLEFLRALTHDRHPGPPRYPYDRPGPTGRVPNCADPGHPLGCRMRAAGCCPSPGQEAGP
ncbi:hypothetical protein FSY75_22080 [Streptomyces sp. TR1341]|nr:hypothetical protein [Streptomyces sp. TR1341]